MGALPLTVQTHNVFISDCDAEELTSESQLRCINELLSARSLSGSTVKVDFVTD